MSQLWSEGNSMKKKVHDAWTEIDWPEEQLRPEYIPHKNPNQFLNAKG
jgi:hypothetical protein